MKGEKDFKCTEEDTPVPMATVGPQGEYNDNWVKKGRPFLDFGEHPEDGADAGKRLFSPLGSIEWIRGYNPGEISRGPRPGGGGNGVSRIDPNAYLKKNRNRDALRANRTRNLPPPMDKEKLHELNSGKLMQKRQRVNDGALRNKSILQSESEAE